MISNRSRSLKHWTFGMAFSCRVNEPQTEPRMPENRAKENAPVTAEMISEKKPCVLTYLRTSGPPRPVADGVNPRKTASSDVRGSREAVRRVSHHSGAVPRLHQWRGSGEGPCRPGDRTWRSLPYQNGNTCSTSCGIRTGGRRKPAVGCRSTRACQLPW